MRSWTLTVKTDMTASGTLSHEGTRRFTGSKSVAVCLGWQADGRRFGFRQSGQAFPAWFFRSATRVQAATRQPMVQADLLDDVVHVLDDHHDA